MGAKVNSGTPDNADHFVDRNSVTGKLDNAVQHGIAQLDVSDMNATLSGSGDVEVYDAYYGTSGTGTGFAGGPIVKTGLSSTSTATSTTFDTT
jgi:hypothetical protein